MFPRHFFFAVCVLGLLAVVAVRANEEEAGDLEYRYHLTPNAFVALVLLVRHFKSYKQECLREVAESCQSHWTDENVLFQCAEPLLQVKKARCFLG